MTSHKPSWSWWGQFQPQPPLCLWLQLPRPLQYGIHPLASASSLPTQSQGWALFFACPSCPPLAPKTVGPWPGPQGPAHLVQFFLSPLPIKLCSLHPFPETSLSSAQSNLASYSTEKGRAHLEATFSRPPCCPDQPGPHCAQPLQPQGLHSGLPPSAASAPSAQEYMAPGDLKKELCTNRESSMPGDQETHTTRPCSLHHLQSP